MAVDFLGPVILVVGLVGIIFFVAEVPLEGENYDELEFAWIWTTRLFASIFVIGALSFLWRFLVKQSPPHAALVLPVTCILAAISLLGAGDWVGPVVLGVIAVACIFRGGSSGVAGAAVESQAVERETPPSPEK